MEDARVYGEAAAWRDRGKEVRSRGAWYALLGRAGVITKDQGGLRNYERGSHDLVISCGICHEPKEKSAKSLD